MLEALREIPLTQTDLKSELGSSLIGWPPAKRAKMLARLIKEKRVYKVKPLAGNGQLLSARGGDAAGLYQTGAVEVARLKSKGLTDEQVITVAREVLQPEPDPPATTSADLERLILERMLQLKPSVATGAPLESSRLRQLRPEIADKYVFDRMVIGLADQGRVAAHRHDYIGNLNQEELARQREGRMVAGGGRPYNLLCAIR